MGKQRVSAPKSPPESSGGDGRLPDSSIEGSKPRVLPWWTLSVALPIGLAAYSFAWLRFEANFAYSKLDSDLTREMLWTTESAFYYSYYRDVVDASSLSAAFEQLVRNDDTEYPDTINILHRFNVLQEVALGVLHRCFSSIAVLSPIHFYVQAAFALYGISVAGLFVLVVVRSFFSTPH